MNIKKQSLLYAFQHTFPLLPALLFLGMSFGFLMVNSGFNIFYPIFISIFVFAGSLEFLLINILLTTFNPINTFILSFIVNARHIFYGLSMLKKYNQKGLKKFYLIYTMCDETFAINYNTKIEKGIDKTWFMIFVSMFNQIYWVSGSILGSILEKYININFKGIEFLLIALFFVLFLEQLLDNKKYFPAFLGLFVSYISLLIFGKQNFIIPTMIIIILAFTIKYKLSKNGDF